MLPSLRRILPRTMRASSRVLAAGWCAPMVAAAAVAVAAAPWSDAGSMSTGRYAPTAIPLADGSVLVAGGYNFDSRQTLASAELFDPRSGKWQPAGAMDWDRDFAEAAPLPDGTYLVIGGYRENRGTTEVVERFDPRALRFTRAASLNEERELFTATPLRDGRVLVTAGYSTRRRRTLDSMELFDPATGRWELLPGRLTEPRFGHAALLLPDGRVLIAGGKVIPGERRALSLEIFDPATGQCARPGPSLRAGRDRPTLSLIDAGPRVLIAGGSSESGTAPARESEIFNVATGELSAGPTLTHERMAHTATRLPDGRLLLLGGWNDATKATVAEAEFYDPTANRFLVAGAQRLGRHDHAAVILRDGRILVAGGKRARPGLDDSPADAELFTPPPP